MRLLAWFLFGLTCGVVLLYLLGMWLLHMTWREFKEIFTHPDVTPLMYDGKESFEEWSRKMELGRQLQAKDDADHV